MSPVLAVFVSAALALGPAPARLPAGFQELEAHVQDLAGQKRYRELAVAGAAAFERRDLAGVSGALAGLGVLGAVTLFALRARRGSTLAGPWVGPAGAGLTIRGRF